MPHVQYWARVRAGMDCPLRRGAWYRVVELTPGETVLEVNSRLLRVPRAFLQILPLRPPWGHSSGAGPTTRPPPAREGSTPAARAAASPAPGATPRPPLAAGHAAPGPPSRRPARP